MECPTRGRPLDAAEIVPRDGILFGFEADALDREPLERADFVTDQVSYAVTDDAGPSVAEIIQNLLSEKCTREP